MLKLVLDIEEEMWRLEDIFKKYIPIPEGAVFIPNNRLPIEGYALHNNKHSELVSNRPYLPYICLECVSNILTNFVYRYNPYKEVFKRNDIIANGENLISVVDYEIEEIIGWYIDYIDTNDLEEVIDICNRIYSKMKVYTKQIPKNIITFDFEGPNYLLVDRGDVHEFRYKEILDKKDYITIEGEDRELFLTRGE